MTTAFELKDDKNARIMAFNIRFLKEALDFIVCSDNEYIDIYYNGRAQSLIMKSARLYVAVLPVNIDTVFNNFKNSNAY